MLIIDLDTCHASLIEDFRGAVLLLLLRSTSSNHFKYVAECVTQAKLLIKIIQSGNAIFVWPRTILLKRYWKFLRFHQM